MQMKGSTGGGACGERDQFIVSRARVGPGQAPDKDAVASCGVPETLRRVFCWARARCDSRPRSRGAAG